MTIIIDLLPKVNNPTVSQGMIITTIVGLALFAFAYWNYTHFPGGPGGRK